MISTKISLKNFLETNIIHGDIKPDNLMFVKEDMKNIKAIDFNKVDIQRDNEIPIGTVVFMHIISY